MAKKFMFVCIGILALTVAFLLGAQFGRADYVDHSATGIVSMLGWNKVLLNSGEVWLCDYVSGVWQLDTETTQMLGSSGVSPSQIKFIYDATTFVTLSDEVFHNDWLGWHNWGSPPGGGPTRTQPSTWGSIKAQFKN